MPHSMYVYKIRVQKKSYSKNKQIESEREKERHTHTRWNYILCVKCYIIYTQQKHEKKNCKTVSTVEHRI